MLEKSYIRSTNIKVLRKNFLFASILAVVLFITACTSKKTTTGFVGRTYQDITLHYNYYFNARLIYNQTLKSLEATKEEDYTKLLPMHEFGKVDAQAVTPDMDKIIKKASVGIRLQPNSKWVDDSYLLIGKAQFLKGNYEEAVKTLQFLTSEFESGIRLNEKSSKRAKRRAKQKKNEDKNLYYESTLSFLKHKPARWEAMIWIIRSYTAMEKYTEAQSIIAFAKGDKLFPEQLEDELEIAIAEFYLKKGEMDNASKSIQQLISLTDKKKMRTRYTFILGQIHEKNKNISSAIQSYRDVLKLNPDYEMEFFAKMNIANLSRLDATANNDEIIALLKDLLKNEKYNKFKGEIYFSLAEIYLAQGKTDLAIETFNFSVQHSTKSDQKAYGYLRLGELYFDKEKYVVSKAYYDSTLNVLPKDNPNFDQINNRSNILTGLVDQIEIIERQDSLQRLAKLSDSELEKIIQETKKVTPEPGVIEEEFNPLQQNKQVIATNWPFDNPSLKGRGYSEFKRLYGTRPLEDNWRRSSKSSGIVQNDIIEDEDDIISETSTVEDVRKNLPTTDEQIAASNEKIITAYYRLANIYKDMLGNNAKATETFETLMTRFPQNKYRMEVAYNLYLLYKEINPSKSKQYANIVTSEFPESILAKVIQDPNYIESTKRAENVVTDYYASTYQFFENNGFNQVITRSAIADSLYPNNSLMPKFEMLAALSYGKLGMMDSFRSSLEEIVNKYPMHEVKTKAVEILNAMEGTSYNKATNNENKLYLYEPQTAHYLIVIFDSITPKITQMQANLADYNQKYNQFDKLQVSSMLLNNETQVVLVKQFTDGTKAMNYYNNMRYSEEVFKGFSQNEYRVFAISQRNYGVFFRDKDVNEYLKFFSKNYLNID